jgi:hypothetical protein
MEVELEHPEESVEVVTNIRVVDDIIQVKTMLITVLASGDDSEWASVDDGEVE